MILRLASGVVVWLLPLAAEQPPAPLGGKSLEELMEVSIESVTGAAKHEQRVTEAPSSVTVITADQIRRYGWRRLSDVLESVRGFHLSSDRSYQYVGVRGFARPGDYNSRLLVLINGHRVNENVYEGAYIEDGFPIDMDLVERIEIIRGPGSSLYGTNALFAVVQVLTKTAAAFAQPELSLEAASLNTQRARLTYGKTSKKAGDLLVSATGYTSAGQPAIYAPELDERLTGVDGDRAASAYLSWRRGGLVLEAAGSTRKKFAPPLWAGQATDNPNNYGQDTRAYLDASYRRGLGERTEAQGRLYFDRYLFDGNNPYRGEEEGAVVMSREFASGLWWGGEFQVNHQFTRHRLTGGVDARFQPLVHLTTYDADPFQYYGGARTHMHNTGVFAQDEVTLHRQVKLTAGIRLDRYSTFGRAVNPRMALVWTPAKRASLKLLMGRAFRAPNPFELTYRTATYQPNPQLQPERTGSVEGVWEQYWSPGWRTAVSVFQNRISGVIQQTALDDDRLQYVNSGRFAGTGIEGEVAYQQKEGIDFLASYSYQPFRDARTGAQITQAPRSTMKLRASRPVARGRLTVGTELRYTAARLTVNGTPLPALWWPGVTLSTKGLSRHLDVSASTYNASNSTHLHPMSEEHVVQALQQDGRGFRIQLRFRF